MTSRTLPKLLALLALGGATLLAACSVDDGKNQAAVDGCSAACASEKTACPAADNSTCTSLCDAYGITVDTGACEDAFLAWKNCEKAQAYDCTTVSGTTYAVPKDLMACDDKQAAYDAACP